MPLKALRYPVTPARASVQWLTRISAVAEPFGGHQQRSYSIRLAEKERGTPVTRIFPRALMAPPGIAGFLARERTPVAGPCVIEGRSWSGRPQIDRVELGVDGKRRYAALDLPADRWAWRGWRVEWGATPGEHVLSCRARDEAGNVQPDEAEWNVGGYANTAVQRVAVTVAG